MTRFFVSMWSVNITSLLTVWRCPKVDIWLVIQLLFYTCTFRLDVNQDIDINSDAREGISDDKNIEVFDETHIN